MMLSMIAEPDDEITGRVLHRVGGVETIRLIEDDDPVPGMNHANAIAWRQRLTPRIDDNISERIADAERHGMNTLIPTNTDWPHALNDLGSRAPYLLWTHGATSFLSDGLADRVTITGARAATEYDTNVAAHLAGDLARDEHTIVSGGAYGIDGAAHHAALAEGGNTIAILAGGVDRPYPRGHADLLARIGDVGLLASEMAPGAAPTRLPVHGPRPPPRHVLGCHGDPGGELPVWLPARDGRGSPARSRRRCGTRARHVGDQHGAARAHQAGGGQVVSDKADVTAMLDSLGDPARLLNQETPAYPLAAPAFEPSRRPGPRP